MSERQRTTAVPRAAELHLTYSNSMLREKKMCEKFHLEKQSLNENIMKRLCVCITDNLQQTPCYNIIKFALKKKSLVCTAVPGWMLKIRRFDLSRVQVVGFCG